MADSLNTKIIRMQMNSFGLGIHVITCQPSGRFFWYKYVMFCAIKH